MYIFLHKQKQFRNFQFLPKICVNPSEKFQFFFQLQNRHFNRTRMAFIINRTSPKTFSRKGSTFLPFTNRHFSSLKWFVYYLLLFRTSPNTFSTPKLLKKETISKCSSFDKKHGLTPLENFNFWTIHKSTF